MFGLFTLPKITLVTACDSTHFRSMLNFLDSARKHEPSAEMVVYDLGMTGAEVSKIEHQFNLTVQPFDYARYPSFMNVRNAAGEYAWKPQIMEEAAQGRKGIICWMDAGNLIHHPLRRLRREARKAGHFSPHSAGTVSDWTHPGTLDYFGLPHDWMANARNLNGACVAFDLDNPLGIKLLTEWAAYARVKECIAPEGSSRANHRQDQALLTILAYLAGRPQRLSRAARKVLDFSLHNDVDAVDRKG